MDLTQDILIYLNLTWNEYLFNNNPRFDNILKEEINRDSHDHVLFFLRSNFKYLLINYSSELPF